MAEDTELESTVLLSDQPITLASALSSYGVATASTEECNTAQTDCEGCLDAPCQGDTCQSYAGEGSSCFDTCEVTYQGCGDICEAVTQACKEACLLADQSPGSASSIWLVSATKDSLTLRFSSVSKADYYEVAYRTTDTTSATFITVYGTSVTISGLEAATDYVVNYRGVNDYGVGDFILPAGPTFTTKGLLPDLWEWWSTIAVGEPINVSAAEWNAFCTRILEVCDALGTNSRTLATVYSGEEMAASVAENARECIGYFTPDYTYDPGWIEAGKPITAAYFIGLRDYLNHAIEYYS